MKKHWYSDGISMKEWLAFVLVCIYGAISLIFGAKVYLKQLTDQDNEFFWILSWPVMVIVGFYFAEKIALNFGKIARVDASTRREKNEGGMDEPHI